MYELIFEYKDLLKNIYKKGYKINNTRELNTIIIKVNNKNINIKKLKEEIKKLYNKYIENFNEREKLEKTHYERLTAAMLHELTRVQWFTNHDKQQAVESFVNLLKNNNVKDINKITRIKDDIKYDLKDFSSRRNLVFSEDCISLIQFLYRKEVNILNVYIRSSDAFRLLLIDILFGLILQKEIKRFFKLRNRKTEQVNFIIGSAHIYEKDINKIRNIIE